MAFSYLKLQTIFFCAGFACTRQELSEDIKQLYQTGLFESVNARVLPQKKGKFKVRECMESLASVTLQILTIIVPCRRRRRARSR